MFARLHAVGILALVSLIHPAIAQSNTASTTAPLHGQTNRVPQFPSGGVPAMGGSADGTRPAVGQLTAVERRAEQDANKAMQICKGC